MHAENLETRLEECIQSGQSGIWLRTHEPDEALMTLLALVEQNVPAWQINIWDVVKGIQNPNATQQASSSITGMQSASAAIKTMIDFAEDRQSRDILGEHNPNDDQNMILVLRNGHREITNNGATQKEILMAIQHLLYLGKAFRCHLVIFSFPGVELPLELQEQFWIVDHELPNQEERVTILSEVMTNSDLEVPANIEEIGTICGGLTRAQVEGVASRSLVRHEALVPHVLWSLKAETINKKGLLSLYDGDDTFEDLGGLDGLKQFCRLALEPGKPAHVRAKAIMLLGIPGTGKSAFAKALGNEMNRATLSLDVGSLMGSLVGQTEERTRETLKIADAMEPCQLYVDEIEKALGGGTGSNDGGVSSRMKGSLLTWLNDHTSDVFFICTANDISSLPPEFLRQERFDAVFFMDLPSRESKDAIWDLYLNYFNLDASQGRPDDSMWTGAEIRACCRLSALFNNAPLVETATQVVPIMLTAGEKINELRAWANNRCLDAETGEVYLADAKHGKEGESRKTVLSAGRQSRKVSRRAKSKVAKS